MKSTLVVCAALMAVTASCGRSPQQSAATFLQRGKTFLSRKDYFRAELEFKNAARLLPRDAECTYELGLAYLGEGDLNHAVAALFRATELDPKHAGARIKIAELMAQSGDRDLAKEGEKRMRDLLAATPGNSEALNALALSELELGKYQDAESHLREVLEKLPNNLASAKLLVLVYLTRHDYESADRTLKKVHTELPQSADAAVALAQLCALENRLVEAQTGFENALNLDSGNSDALLGLAAVETRLGRKTEAEEAYRKLSGLPDKRYRYMHATYLFSEGQREEGVREFENLARKSPSDRDARSRLVAAYLAMGRAASAENLLSAALKNNSRDTDALVQRSQILLASGKGQEAEADIEQVLHFKPDSAEAHYLLARVEESRGDHARQNAELTEALRYNPSMLPARAALAQLMVLSGSSKAALDVLNSAPKEQAHSLILMLERNLANYAAGNQQAFREGVAQALQTARIPDALLQDAIVKLADRDYTRAQASVTEVLKENPDDIRALKAKALIYSAQNQPKEASTFLIGYAEQTRSATVAQFAGEWLWSAGDRTQARAAWNRAKSLDPHYLPADLALAHADLIEGKVNDARSTLTQVVAAHAENFPGLVLLAVAENRANNVDLAIADYRRALELQPHNGEVLNNLAYLLADKTDQADEALKYAQQAVEALPENADTVGTLGWVLYRKGLYQEAEQQLQRASAKDKRPSDANAVIRKYHLAMTYLRLGERQKGLAALSEVRRENPNFMGKADIIP